MEFHFLYISQSLKMYRGKENDYWYYYNIHFQLVTKLEEKSVIKIIGNLISNFLAVVYISISNHGLKFGLI